NSESATSYLTQALNNLGQRWASKSTASPVSAEEDKVTRSFRTDPPKSDDKTPFSTKPTTATTATTVSHATENSDHDRNSSDVEDEVETTTPRQNVEC
ncbi:hypothetical protein BGZ83_003988, partial [Gryganskiella cystojenkinii]